MITTQLKEPAISTVNTVKHLNFSGARISAMFVSNLQDYYIAESAIVVNPNRTGILLDAQVANIIPPFCSLIVQNARITSGESAVVLQPTRARNPGGIVLEPGWALYSDLIPPGGSFPRDTPLYRSSQDDIGTIAFDPATLPGQRAGSFGVTPYLVKVNLWFSPEKTDCAIHNEHAFIEIHTQVTGCGRMQKFYANDDRTLYHDEPMSPGYTTATPFCEVVDSSTFIYPWHQYYADSDCVWMAVEYHPKPA
ncbi:MAG: hypothetical protein WA510_12025 [Acidobacteriaceae bacterium]